MEHINHENIIETIYKPEYGKKIHPADLNNTSSKNIMCANEEQLKPIPYNKKSLQFELGYNENMCCYCGKEEKKNKLSVDEIIPCSEGGRMNRLNQVNSCKECNQSKGKKSNKEFEFWLLYGNKTDIKITRENKEVYKQFCRKHNIELSDNISCKNLVDKLYNYLCNLTEIIDISSLELKESRVPKVKQKIIIDFINNNINYLKTDNPKLLQYINNIKEDNKKYLSDMYSKSTKKIEL